MHAVAGDDASDYDGGDDVVVEQLELPVQLEGVAVWSVEDIGKCL